MFNLANPKEVSESEQALETNEQIDLQRFVCTSLRHFLPLGPCVGVECMECGARRLPLRLKETPAAKGLPPEGHDTSSTEVGD